MKILVVGDVHWSTYSSIVRSRNDKCSTRLSNLLESVNWAEGEAEFYGCNAVIYLGDFFDKADLTSEELTVLQEVKWSSKIPHYFIVGNHESSVASLKYNSTKALEKEGFHIISEPTVIFDSLVLIPYILEENRKPLVEYLGGIEKPVVFSHNDLKGVRYGAFESTIGFGLDEIRENCTIYINGHLHNQGLFYDGDNIYALNLGNLTGQNFGEDGFLYKHQVMVYHTDTELLEFITNPHAMKFYKIEISDEKEIEKKLGELGNNAVVSIKCKEGCEAELRDAIQNYPNIIAYKIILYCAEASAGSDANIEELTDVDHLKKFKEFVIRELGPSETVYAELSEVCK